VAAVLAALATAGTVVGLSGGAAAAASRVEPAALVTEETAVPGAPNCPMFPADNIWNTDISKLPVDSRSAAWLVSSGTRDCVDPGQKYRLRAAEGSFADTGARLAVRGQWRP
jgi:hypothetical protein